MQKSRKNIDSLLSNVKSLKDRYTYLGKEIIRLLGDSAYEQVIKHYDDLVAKLTEELLSLPIGYSYTGTFYLKKPYIVPATFEKCEGGLFMREDLVSWEITNGVGLPHQLYYRNAFKEPAEGTEIKREDAVPVYKTKEPEMV